MMFKKVKILTVALLLLSAVFFVKVEAAEIEAYNINTNPGQDMSTMMQIRYHSDIEDTFVEYTLASDTLYENSIVVDGECTPWSMPVEVEGGYLSSGFLERNICSVELSNLTPNTEYRYRVGKTVMSEDFTFVTAKGRGETEFSFLHITDPQYGTEADSHIFNNLIQKAYEKDADLRFGFFTGDIVDRGGREEQWNWFFDRSSLRTLPIAAGVGNHEYYDNSGTPKIQSNEYFNQYFHNPSNGHPDLQNSTYFFHYNNALFVMLDTEFQGYASQVAWFREVMETQAAQYIIVGMHKSFYGSQYASQGLAVKNTWRKVFEDYNVDLVLSGHDHIYARTVPMYQDKPTTNPNLGITYIIGGSGGRKFYSVNTSPTSNTQYYDHYVENTSVANIITVTESNLTIELIDLQGNTLDTATLPSKRPLVAPSTMDKDAFMNNLRFYTYETDMRQGQVIWGNGAYPNVARVRVFRNETDSVAISTTYITDAKSTQATFFGLREGELHRTKIEVLFRDGTTLEKIEEFVHKKAYGALSNPQVGEVGETTAILSWETAFLNNQVKQIEIYTGNTLLATATKSDETITLENLTPDTIYDIRIVVVDIFDDAVQEETLSFTTEAEEVVVPPVEEEETSGCKKATAIWAGLLALGFVVVFKKKEQ